MPLYEYECNSCDKTVEILVRGDAQPLSCSECGEKELQRVFSVPSAPAVKSKSSLPMASDGPDCGAPRCCGGGCQI